MYVIHLEEVTLRKNQLSYALYQQRHSTLNEEYYILLIYLWERRLSFLNKKEKRW